jgi:hypothetical protein
MLAAGEDPLAVAGCFEQALTDARAHGASFLVLRAATSLARLTRAGGDRARESITCLRAAYTGLPSRLDTPDLRDARALLAATP